MGREVRMVPADWEHPKRDDGKYIPLMGGSYRKRLKDWNEEAAYWEKGFRKSFTDDKWVPKDADDTGTFEEWDGKRPCHLDYMPDWTDEERTHYQMYEDTSEGTPISPVMATPEELARWLADSGASSLADRTATYEQWLSMIKRGWAVSAVASPKTGMISGVEAETEL